MRAASTKYGDVQLHEAFARYLSRELFETLKSMDSAGAYRTPDSAAHNTLAREHQDRAYSLTAALSALRLHSHQLLIEQDRVANGSTVEEYTRITHSKWTDQGTALQLAQPFGSAALSLVLALGAFQLVSDNPAIQIAAGPILMVTFLTSFGLSGYSIYKLEKNLIDRKASSEFPAHRAAADAALREEIKACDLELLQSFIAGAADHGFRSEDALARWTAIVGAVTPHEACAVALKIRVAEPEEDAPADVTEEEATATSKAHARL